MRKLGWQFVECPVGRLIVAELTQGLALLTWCDRAANGPDLIRRRLGEKGTSLAHASLTKHVACIEHFFDRHGAGDPPVLDETGTNFQRRVWHALRTIPCGAVRSYTEIARAINHPTTVRTVTGACGANPVSLFTPCHRVIRANGEIGGYGGGVGIKRALLDREHPNFCGGR